MFFLKNTLPITSFVTLWSQNPLLILESYFALLGGVWVRVGLVNDFWLNGGGGEDRGWCKMFTQGRVRQIMAVLIPDMDGPRVNQTYVIFIFLVSIHLA